VNKISKMSGSIGRQESDTKQTEKKRDSIKQKSVNKPTNQKPWEGGQDKPSGGSVSGGKRQRKKKNDKKKMTTAAEKS